MTANENQTTYDLRTKLWIAFVVALPLSAVIAGLSTVYIAVKNSDSVVFEKIVKDGKSISVGGPGSSSAESSAKIATLNISSNPERDIKVFIPGYQPREQAAKNEIQLHIIHPTRKELDRSTSLSLSSGNDYYSSVANPFKGLAEANWHVILQANDLKLRGRIQYPSANQEGYSLQLTNSAYADY